MLPIKSNSIISLLFLVILLSFQKSIYACSCNPAGSFIEVAPSSSIIVLVKTIEYTYSDSPYFSNRPMNLKAEVIDNFLGEERRDTITIWGDNGALCRPYITNFKLGKYYLLALENGSERVNYEYYFDGYGHKNEKFTDYAISICGQYWLEVDFENQLAKNVKNGKQKFDISLKELKRILNEKFQSQKEPIYSSTDVNEIFQVFLDTKQLQQYYRIEEDSTRKQVYIKYFGGHHDNLKNVNKFGLPVKMLTEKEIAMQQIKSYLDIKSFINFKQNDARIFVEHPTEGILIFCAFTKKRKKWKVSYFDVVKL